MLKEVHDQINCYLLFYGSIRVHVQYQDFSNHVLQEGRRCAVKISGFESTVELQALHMLHKAAR